MGGFPCLGRSPAPREESRRKVEGGVGWPTTTKSLSTIKSFQFVRTHCVATGRKLCSYCTGDVTNHKFSNFMECVPSIAISKAHSAKSGACVRYTKCCKETARLRKAKTQFSPMQTPPKISRLSKGMILKEGCPNRITRARLTRFATANANVRTMLASNAKRKVSFERG